MDSPFDQPTIPQPGGRYQAGLKVFGGRFVLERRIGRGGMGEVWLAQDTELGDMRALKFLPSEVAADPKALAQLRREAIAGRRLSHPRIVRVDDFYSDAAAGMAAVAMEFVEGRTLNEIQAETEKGYFEVAEIEGWIRDVCEALDYAHGEAKVVHRDLKPSNIIIEKATGRAKVLDFGIARRIAETHTQLTGKDSSGTLAYMSPQQVDGERGLPSDDVYALGATIYELLTGTPPFFRGDLRQQINMKVAPSMTARRAELADEGMVLGGGSLILASWERGVAACLAKEAGRRPGSAAEVMRRLSGVAEQPAPAEPAARPAPVAAPASAPVQREPAAERAAAAIEKAPVSSRGRKPPTRVIAMAAVLVLGVVGLAGWMLSGGDNTAKPDAPALSDRSARSDPSRVAAPPEPPALPQVGALRIVSEPSGARVEDSRGGYMGTTPLPVENLPAGKEAGFRLELAGYAPESVNGVPLAGETRTLGTVKLTPLPQDVRITSTPSGAEVWDGNLRLDTTPTTVRNMMPGTRVSYVLKKEGYEDAPVSGTVAVGRELVLSGNLREKPRGPSLAGGKIGDDLKFPIGGGEEIVLKYVPGGRFQMGSPIGEADRNDNEDQVWVTLSSHFWMGETEVTQGQWVAVMGSNPSHFKGGDWKKLPVENVSWDDAQEFIKKLNAENPPGAGWKWALPTEAQWERACRGGTTTATAYGDSLSSGQANLNGYWAYGGVWRGGYLEKTAPVMSYEPNAYGLYDMHGNVSEWCLDAYQKALPGGADPLVSTHTDRVFRGGSWHFGGRYCRSAFRFGVTPGIRDRNNGFRLAAVPAGR